MNKILDDATIASIKQTGAHILTHLPKAAFYVICVAILYFISKRIIRFFVQRTSPTFAIPVLRGTKYFFIFSALLLICSAYEVDMSSIWTMLGTVSALVAVGFVAVWSVLSNISCTVLILFFQPFEVGDEIEFPENNGPKGKVVGLNFAYTTLRDNEGRLLQIPNNLFFQRIVKRKPTEVAMESLATQLRKKEGTHAPWKDDRS